MYLKRFSWRSICSLCVINHTFFPKIYSHCGDEFGIEFIVCVSIEKCCLPDSWVSKGQEFNQIIIVSISHSDGLGGPARGAGAARALVSGFGARSGLPELRVPASNHRAPAASLTESRSWALLLASATCGCWSIVARPDSPQPLPVKTASGKAGSTTLAGVRLGGWDQEGLCEKKACPWVLTRMCLAHLEPVWLVTQPCACLWVELWANHCQQFSLQNPAS